MSMSHEDIKAAFADAVSHVVSNISQYAAGPAGTSQVPEKWGLTGSSPSWFPAALPALG